jgi:hypothetical protein
MAVANRKPLFVGKVESVFTSCPATANTNRDGTGTITQIYTGGADCGSLAEVIKASGLSTTTTGILNLFFKESGGSTWRFVGQADAVGATPSATVKSTEVYFAGEFMPIRLGPGDALGFAPTQANAYGVFVEGGLLKNTDDAPVAQ